MKDEDQRSCFSKKTKNSTPMPLELPLPLLQLKVSCSKLWIHFEKVSVEYSGAKLPEAGIKVSDLVVHEKKSFTPATVLEARGVNNLVKGNHSIFLFTNQVLITLLRFDTCGCKI